MEAKKSEHLKLEKNSGLYFPIGLSLVLALIYIALEWKTYDSNKWDIGRLDPPNELIENVPVTIQKLPPPPPPKIQEVPVIEIIENEEDIIETIIESEDTNQDTEVTSIESIEVIENDGPEEVPFIIIENAPVFPGCENIQDKKACFQEMMLKHVKRNFRYPQIAQEMGLQGRVSVLFTIQKDGSIANIKMRGPHESLKAEAARIISKLPTMTPGKQRGKAVKVPFSMPITFRLQ